MGVDIKLPIVTRCALCYLFPPKDIALQLSILPVISLCISNGKLVIRAYSSFPEWEYGYFGIETPESQSPSPMPILLPHTI